MGGVDAISDTQGTSKVKVNQNDPVILPCKAKRQ